MSRAEERAKEYYPMKDYNKEPNYIHSCDSKMLDEVYREVFMLGYNQAVKDINKELMDRMAEIQEKITHDTFKDIDYGIVIQDYIESNEAKKD